MASGLCEIVLISSPDGPIMAYDASSGSVLANFCGSQSPQKLALAGNSIFAASYISSNTTTSVIHLYNWSSPTAFQHISVPEPVAPLAATLDGLFLFSGGLSGSIYAHSLPSGNQLKSSKAHNKPVSCLKINNEGTILVSGGDDGTISVFPILNLVDKTDGRNLNCLTLHQFVGHDSSVTAIACGLGGCNFTIISSSLDCTCKFWNLLEGTLQRTVRFPCTIWDVEMDPMECEFYAAGSDGLIYSGPMKAFNRKMSKQCQTLNKWSQVHSTTVTNLVLLNEGRNLISSSEEGSVCVWNVETRKVVLKFGQDLASIGDLVVARGVGNGANLGARFGSSSDRFVDGCTGSVVCPDKDMIELTSEAREMEEALAVVGKDRSRTIDALESAIEAYQTLLELILKEAKGGVSRVHNDAENNDN